MTRRLAMAAVPYALTSAKDAVRTPVTGSDEVDSQRGIRVCRMRTEARK